MAGQDPVIQSKRDSSNDNNNSEDLRNRSLLKTELKDHYRDVLKEISNAQNRLPLNVQKLHGAWQFSVNGSTSTLITPYTNRTIDDPIFPASDHESLALVHDRPGCVMMKKHSIEFDQVENLTLQKQGDNDTTSIQRFDRKLSVEERYISCEKQPNPLTFYDRNVQVSEVIPGSETVIRNSEKRLADHERHVASALTPVNDALWLAPFRIGQISYAIDLALQRKAEISTPHGPKNIGTPRPTRSPIDGSISWLLKRFEQKPNMDDVDPRIANATLEHSRLYRENQHPVSAIQVDASLSYIPVFAPIEPPPAPEGPTDDTTIARPGPLVILPKSIERKKSVSKPE